MNKIISNFYLIRLDGVPVYIGYTNRPIKTRFSEHKHDKDFGDIEPTVESLGKLEYDFTWDMSLINIYANEVSNKENELIMEYGTKDTVWQRGTSGSLGGQTWANVKYFVKANRDNPIFREMGDSDIMVLLEWQRRSYQKLRGMVNNTNIKGAKKLNNMVNDTNTRGAQNLKNMVKHTNIKGAQKLNNMVSHTNIKGAQKIQSMVNTTNIKGARNLHNMVNHTNIKGAQKLKDMVNHTNIKGAQKIQSMVNITNIKGARNLHNMINNTSIKGAQKIRNMVKHTNIKGAQKLKDMVNHTKAKP